MAAIPTVNCTETERAATRSITAVGVSDGSGRFYPYGRPADSDCLGSAGTHGDNKRATLAEGVAMTKILEVPLEDAVDVLGAAEETLLCIERHDDGIWLLVESLTGVAEYRLTRDATGRSVVLVPTEAMR